MGYYAVKWGEIHPSFFIPRPCFLLQTYAIPNPSQSGIIHKPRGQLRGSQPNDHFITQALFSKSDHKGGGGQNTQNFDHVVSG